MPVSIAKWSVLLVLAVCLLSGCVDQPKDRNVYFQEHSFKKGFVVRGEGSLNLNVAGRYALKIQTELPPENPVKVEGVEFSLEYKVIGSAGTLREGLSTKLDSPWRGDGSYGFILTWLNIPDQLPISAPLQIEYTIQVNEEYIELYGRKLGLGIWKLSDM